MEAPLYNTPHDVNDSSQEKELASQAGIRQRRIMLIASIICILGAGSVYSMYMHVRQTTSNMSPLDPLPASFSKESQTHSAHTNPFREALPLGDGKVVTDKPRVGYVYSCTKNFRQSTHTHEGDWIEGAWWDPMQKIRVQGAVEWPTAYVTITTTHDERIISSNDLPDHHTGIFPVLRTDPAYNIDPNPNAIREQDILYRLPVKPEIAATPFCTTRGAVGIMTNGVMLFNALDDAGLDAAAHEIQDSCDGHPQGTDAYHYHNLSSCIEDKSARQVIGYALDGFGITGPKKNDGTYYSTEDLDECHGTTSSIIWDGEEQTMYHYVMTADYPYSISCFKGTPEDGRLHEPRL